MLCVLHSFGCTCIAQNAVYSYICSRKMYMYICVLYDSIEVKEDVRIMLALTVAMNWWSKEKLYIKKENT